MQQAIEEGRNAIQGLRSTRGDSPDLEQAFSRIQQELAIEDEDQADFRVVVEGRPRSLHPDIGDEVYRIGHEALVNAFRHSQAKSIEVELEYAAKHLRLVVRDNGCGIDPHFLQKGREGHWGLSSMRERKESTHDSKCGAVPEPERRSNCPSPAILPSNTNHPLGRSDGWPASSQERRDRAILREMREFNEQPRPYPSPQR